MANCEECKSKRIPESVPYVVHEGEMARSERHIKRMWIALIVSVVLIFVSNALWLYAWMQYDYTSEETVVDVNSADGGNANYIGNDGDIVNGTNYGNEEETKP